MTWQSSGRTSAVRRFATVIGWAAALALGVAALTAQEVRRFTVTGMVVRVDRAARTMTVSHDAIPGFMDAMTMPFAVPPATALDALVPGTVVTFTLVVGRTTAAAEAIRVVAFENVEQDPFNASRLKLLSELARQKAVQPPPAMVAVGATVPDFTLIDQMGRRVTLSQWRGRVVVVNFVYTRCALPNYCLRLANHFGVLQKRFARQLGRDLVLLTLTFDPEHDTPEALATYARQWPAHPDAWRFLTGAPADVARACASFGVHAFSNEGLLDHSLHTAVIDRQGRLVANIEGNQFTAAQLGDLTASVMAAAR